jgi:hypothetical protein
LGGSIAVTPAIASVLSSPITMSASDNIALKAAIPLSTRSAIQSHAGSLSLLPTQMHLSFLHMFATVPDHRNLVFRASLNRRKTHTNVLDFRTHKFI